MNKFLIAIILAAPAAQAQTTHCNVYGSQIDCSTNPGVQVHSTLDTSPLAHMGDRVIDPARAQAEGYALANQRLQNQLLQQQIQRMRDYEEAQEHAKSRAQELEQQKIAKQAREEAFKKLQAELADTRAYERNVAEREKAEADLKQEIAKEENRQRPPLYERIK